MVLFAGRYNDSENLTGSEKVAKRIFHLHIKNEEAVFVQYFFDGSKYSLFKKLFGKDIKTVNEGSNIITLGLFRILFIPFTYKPTVIHIITFERFAVLLYFYKIFSKTRFVFNIHGIVTFGNYKLKNLAPYYRLKDKFCEKIFLKFSDIIVIPSAKYIALAKKYFIFKEDKVKIVPNGCDFEFSNVMRSEIHDPKLNISLLFDKIGINDSINFINDTLKKIGKKVDIFEIRGTANNTINNNRIINGKVFVRMDTEGFAVFLGKMDIFLSLNKYDTFSISALEAMAAGVVPIVTEDTGLSKYIENGKNGFIIQFGESDKLEEIINSLHASTELRMNISNKARDIYSKLNWENVYSDYADIYNQKL